MSRNEPVVLVVDLAPSDRVSLTHPGSVCGTWLADRCAPTQFWDQPAGCAAEFYSEFTDL
jgi:hypothetical protein